MGALAAAAYVCVVCECECSSPCKVNQFAERISRSRSALKRNFYIIQAIEIGYTLSSRMHSNATAKCIWFSPSNVLFDQSFSVAVQAVSANAIRAYGLRNSITWMCVLHFTLCRTSGDSLLAENVVKCEKPERLLIELTTHNQKVNWKKVIGQCLRLSCTRIVLLADIVTVATHKFYLCFHCRATASTISCTPTVNWIASRKSITWIELVSSHISTMKLKTILVPLQIYIVLCVACGAGSPTPDGAGLARPKRTLHYFIEGILSAFAEKNRSRTHTSPLSGITKLSAFSINQRKPSSSEETEGTPNQYAIPSQQMPTRVSLPLVTEKTTTSTVATTSTTSTTTSTTPIPTTTDRSETITEVPTSMPTTEAPTSVEETQTLPTDTTDSPLTTLVPCSDEQDVFSTLLPQVEPTLSNEILSKSDSNETSPLGADARQLPLYQNGPLFRAISGRHTQFFGNPMILERHQDDQTPTYYDEYDCGHANDIEPNKGSSLHGFKYLPQPLIILPMAVPVPSADLNGLIAGNEISRSRIKMHDSNTHQYTWHTLGSPAVPIVNLHQAHVQFFAHKEWIDSTYH